MWDDYHIFLIATLAFTRLLLDDILQPYRIAIWLIDDVESLTMDLRWYQYRFEKRFVNSFI